MEQQLHQQPTPKAQSPSEQTGSELIVATFKWPAALGGSSVSIVGSFNGWSTPLPLGRAANGDFVRSVCLPAGSIQYKYIGEWALLEAHPPLALCCSLVLRSNMHCGQVAVTLSARQQLRFLGCAVDAVWQSSPCEPLVSDGSGNYNNYRLVQSTATLVWKGPVTTSSPVLITGDWSSWGELLPMRRNPTSGTYMLNMCLAPGTYTYSFLVDDAWQLCSNTATGYNEAGLLANKCVAGRAWRCCWDAAEPLEMMREVILSALHYRRAAKNLAVTSSALKGLLQFPARLGRVCCAALCWARDVWGQSVWALIWLQGGG